MDDLLFQTTVAAARRLLKSRLRLLVYRYKQAEAGGDSSWLPLIQMEEGFEIEAQHAWKGVKACWDRGPVSDSLQEAALSQAMSQARSDVIRYFEAEDMDPTWLRDRLLEA